MQTRYKHRSIFRFRDIKAFHTPKTHLVQRGVFRRTSSFVAFDSYSNMKLLLIVSFIAAAILAGQGYTVEDTNAWFKEVKETMKEMEDQAELQKLEDHHASNNSHIGPTDNPHGCNCDDECNNLHHSRVPFMDKVSPCTF